jgi:CelD/BcsL family acetyltransferase involved in cellulose biosynthesis
LLSALVYVRCVESIAELEPYARAWETLAAGNVFRSWTWLSAWWRHYGEGDGRRELRVFVACRERSGEPASLVGLLPCYVEARWAKGRVLRRLGAGEVCSDHVGLLVRRADAEDASDAIAAHVAQRHDWDLIDFAGVDGEDAATLRFFEGLAFGGCTTSRLLGERCWAIELPSSWEEFLGLQSKSHRKQLRQMERRVLDSERARWRLVQTADEFEAAWTTLIDLHQRRRQSLGEPGCFALARWAAFHRDAALWLLAESRLRLSTLELDGRAVAAEYHLAGEHATYAYQGGVDPDRLDDDPGQLSTICSIKRAIDEGHAQFDFLRGDEPYKAHWRAVPRQALRLVAVPPRLWPRLRHRTWSGASEFARGARQLLAPRRTSAVIGEEA